VLIRQRRRRAKKRVSVTGYPQFGFFQSIILNTKNDKTDLEVQIYIKEMKGKIKIFKKHTVYPKEKEN
jgi:hypothetical protein